MRLQRIYSSKLYVTSSRKDKIKAAMQDPINAPLIMQLEDYLDDEAQVELKEAESFNQKKSGGTEDKGGEVIQPSDDSFGGAPSGGSSGGPSLTGDIMSDFGDDELADIDIPDEGGNEEEPSDAVESVTQEGKKITATSLIWTTPEDVTHECNTIQGTLNAREDTKGVTRLQVKDEELWIYYNDDVNLNDKMVEVIEVLNSTGYTYLTFNRLARSNNAIVFDVLLNDNGDIKSKQQIDKEK